MIEITASISIGDVFGRLRVLEEAPRGGINHNRLRWHCICECGNATIVMASNLKSGNSKTCGCAQRISNSIRLKTLSRKHGQYKTRLFKIWDGIIQRTGNPNATGYHNYGGRGIRLYGPWLDFTVFAAAVGQPPSPGHTMDRYPNKDGNYEPGNVRWATSREQNANRRDNVLVQYDGEVMIATELARRLGLTDSAIYGRIRRGTIARINR